MVGKEEEALVLLSLALKLVCDGIEEESDESILVEVEGDTDVAEVGVALVELGEADGRSEVDGGAESVDGDAWSLVGVKVGFSCSVAFEEGSCAEDIRVV